MEILSYNHYAGFFKRFIAFMIDYVFARFILIALFGFATDIDMFEFHNLLGPRTIVVELLMMAYFVFCESSSWQGTLGKKALGLKVVDTNLQRITVGTAIVRYLTKYLSSILLLGYIWIIFDSRKQGWHDKLANTFVID